MNDVLTQVHEGLERTLARLKRALAQPSIAAQNLGMAEMAELLTGELRSVGFSVESVPTQGAPVLLARLEGRRPDYLLFYNHYDVQPPEPVELWTSPPFEPTVREGKLYARGVADNKGAIFARLAAVESYLRARGRLPVGIAWVIEGEEEIGSVHLHQFVEARAELLRHALGCLWEAGGRNATDRYEIALGCKGILYVELRVRGAARDLHSAMAAIVPNPAWRLAWALENLKGPDERVQLPGFYESVRPPTPAQRALLAAWDYPEDEVRQLYGIPAFLEGLTGPALKERLLFGPTCNICGFHSGYGGPGSKTVLPAEAVAKLDFRLVPDQAPEEIVKALRAHLDAQGFTDVEIAWWEGERPFAGDPERPFVQKAVRAAERVYSHKPTVLPLMAGTGPVHLLCGQFGVPIVTAGVGYADSRAHAPDENIRLADFVQGIEYVAAVLDELEQG